MKTNTEVNFDGSVLEGEALCAVRTVSPAADTAGTAQQYLKPQIRIQTGKAYIPLVQ